MPWLKKRHWASGRIKDRSSTFVFFSVLFSVILNTLAWLAMVSVWRDHSGGAGLFALPVVLVILAAAMLTWTIRQIMVRVKFGRSVFEMETIPGAIGGWLAGTIRVPVILDARQVRIELECVGRYTIDSFGKRTMSEHRIFHRQQTLAGDLPRQDNCTCIPVAFEIPAKMPPSGRDGRDDILWRLHARADEEGADYDAAFIVPVFIVPDHIAVTPRAEAVAAPLRNRSRNNHVLASSGE